MSTLRHISAYRLHVPYCCRLRSFLLVRSGTNYTEAYVVALEASVVVVPVGNLVVAVVVVVAVAATTAIAVVAAVVRGNIPTPLPDITAHVVESVSVCLFLCHRMGFIPTVL